MTNPLRLAVATSMLAFAALSPNASATRLLVLSAFPAEQAVLLARAGNGLLTPLTEADGSPFNGRRFFVGKIGDKDVVIGLVGIGLDNATATTEAVIAKLGPFDGIVFSGVAGGHRIGDVMVPDCWTDHALAASDPCPLPVNATLLATASQVAAQIEPALNPCLPIEDVACVGFRSDFRTSICITQPLEISVGGLGFSSDPYNGHKVPCITPGGDLLGCEACGAPPAVPGVAYFAAGAAEIAADPTFFPGLFASFAPQPGDPNAQAPVVVDMETAAVAAAAAAHSIPFIGFRAASDSDTGGGDPLMLPGFPFTFFVYAQLAADNAATMAAAFIESWPL